MYSTSSDIMSSLVPSSLIHSSKLSSFGAVTISMEKTFHFMDGLQADREARRKMRRHVMLGKNAGKTIHRPSRRDGEKSREVTGGAVVAKNSKPYGSTDWQCVSSSIIGRPLGNTFLTISLPVRLTTQALQVVNECK